MNWPNVEKGAKMYARDKIGNKMPIIANCIVWMTIFLRLNPGNPSYQIEANNCWTLACAQNCLRKLVYYLKVYCCEVFTKCKETVKAQVYKLSNNYKFLLDSNCQFQTGQLHPSVCLCKYFRQK